MTIQIQQLERELGAALLERTTQGVRTTALGRQVKPAFERVLNDLDLASRSFREWVEGEAGLVTVAPLRSVAATVIPKALVRFQAAYPRIRVRLIDEVDPHIATMVARGEVDFGIATNEYVGEGVRFEEIIQDHATAVMPPSHALARRRTVTLRSLLEEPLIVTETGLRRSLERAFASLGEVLYPAYETQYIPAIFAMVRAGLGVGILPLGMVESDSAQGVVWRRITHGALTRQIGFLTRVGTAPSPAAERFLKTLRVVFREMAQARKNSE